jgi:hypothetical protein
MAAVAVVKLNVIEALLDVNRRIGMLKLHIRVGFGKNCTLDNAIRLSSVETDQTVYNIIKHIDIVLHQLNGITFNAPLFSSFEMECDYVTHYIGVWIIPEGADYLDEIYLNDCH